MLQDKAMGTVARFNESLFIFLKLLQDTTGDK